MKTVDFKLGSGNVELKAYILDASKEMPFSEKRPAVLILPGGGYKFCSDREGEPIAMAFLAEGYHAFVLKYSVGEGADFKTALLDADDAMNVVRKYSAEWKVDVEKLVVCGFSAGGHLAAALATSEYARPNAMVLGYPCIVDGMNQGLQFPVPSIDKRVDANTPPAFIFHTCNDDCVPVANTVMMAYALTKARVPYELHIYDKGAHGLSLAKKITDSGNGKTINPAVSAWFPRCVDWLASVLKL